MRPFSHRARKYCKFVPYGLMKTNELWGFGSGSLALSFLIFWVLLGDSSFNLKRYALLVCLFQPCKGRASGYVMWVLDSDKDIRRIDEERYVRSQC